MTPTDFSRGLRSPTIELLCGLKLTLVVVATAWLATPTISHAGIIYSEINYNFERH